MVSKWPKAITRSPDSRTRPRPPPRHHRRPSLAFPKNPPTSSCPCRPRPDRAARGPARSIRGRARAGRTGRRRVGRTLNHHICLVEVQPRSPEPREVPAAGDGRSPRRWRVDVESMWNSASDPLCRESLEPCAETCPMVRDGTVTGWGADSGSTPSGARRRPHRSDRVARATVRSRRPPRAGVLNPGRATGVPRRRPAPSLAAPAIPCSIRAIAGAFTNIQPAGENADERGETPDSSSLAPEAERGPGRSGIMPP
jgi:hypothetical protein